MMILRLLLLALLAALASLSPPAIAETKDGFGILVMAHGGGPKWNAEVETMLAPLKQEYPLELAFGMGDPTAMEAAVRKLEVQGVKRIGVVRLFISGDSFLERTQQILGLVPGAPPKPKMDDAAAHAHHEGHDMSLWRIDSTARFALSREGLADAAEMSTVLAERAHALSTDPAHESVLILAHGPGDDAENERWIAAINARADMVRAAAPYRQVTAMTLREDWPERREEAEKRIRAFVEGASRDGGRAIVIPYRVAGFGPYTKVLEGLDYVSDGRGLVPSDEIRKWVQRQAEVLKAGR